MIITYSLWQGSQLLSVNNKANKPEEILAIIEELNKLGKGFTFNVREVNTNEQTTNQHCTIVSSCLRRLYVPPNVGGSKTRCDRDHKRFAKIIGVSA